MRGRKIGRVGQIFDVDLRFEAPADFEKGGGVDPRIGGQNNCVADGRVRAGLMRKPKAQPKAARQIIPIPQA